MADGNFFKDSGEYYDMMMNGNVPRKKAKVAEPTQARTVSEGSAVVGVALTASHLLVKHRHSRRPSSWRCEVIKCSKEEAVEKLTSLRTELTKNEDPQQLEAAFEALARKESDCSTASKGGSLGTFRRGKLQKRFEAVAFALEPGELSGVVETDSGVSASVAATFPVLPDSHTIRCHCIQVHLILVHKREGNDEQTPTESAVGAQVGEQEKPAAVRSEEVAPRRS